MTFWTWIHSLSQCPLKCSYVVFQGGGSVSPHSVKVGGLKPAHIPQSPSVLRKKSFHGRALFCRAVHQSISILCENESQWPTSTTAPPLWRFPTGENSGAAMSFCVEEKQIQRQILKGWMSCKCGSDVKVNSISNTQGMEVWAELNWGFSHRHRNILSLEI